MLVQLEKSSQDSYTEQRNDRKHFRVAILIEAHLEVKTICNLMSQGELHAGNPSQQTTPFNSIIGCAITKARDDCKNKESDERRKIRR